MPKMNPQHMILEAANTVLLRNGMTGATIDAVAKEAGVSKGGLLHYHPSKENLFASMMEYKSGRFFERRDEILAALPGRPGDVIRATMAAVIEYVRGIDEQAPSNIGILAEPAYRRIIGDMKKRMYEEMAAQTGHPEKIAVLMHIVDGLWINLLFRPQAPPKEIFDAAMRLIDDMIEDAAG